MTGRSCHRSWSEFCCFDHEHLLMFLQVSTLFEEEEESSIFPLNGAAVDLSCPSNPSTTQEEMAQSAHLMTLGLCRISSAKPRPAPPADSSLLPQRDESGTDGQIGVPPRGRHRLCLLCPLTLPSRRLLDVHIRSHQAGGGFGCICCSWTTDSWEELEPHWRGHCRRKRRRREEMAIFGRTKRKTVTQDNKSAG